jgi:hypothetical protein
MSSPKKIVHLSHHKAGTVLIKNFLSILLEETGRKVVHDEDCSSVVDFSAGARVWRADITESVRMFSCGEPQYSIFNFSQLRKWYNFPVKDRLLISHSVRDPRDMVVSGYFYHSRCSEELEPWVFEKQHEENWPRYWLREKGEDANRVYDDIVKCYLKPNAGLIKQNILKKMEKKEALIYEMFVMLHEPLRQMHYWKEAKEHAETDGDLIKEIKYEDIMKDFEGSFSGILDFYEITEKREQILERIQDLDTSTWNKKQVKNDPHVSFKYKENRWKEHFTDETKYLFKLFFGDILIDFGYEKDYNW